MSRRYQHFTPSGYLLGTTSELLQVVSTMASLGSRLGSALGTRDRMMMVMKRLDELERYLDPEYGEGLEVCDNVKLDLVLGREDQLRSFHNQLITLNSLKHVMDSQHIKGQYSCTPVSTL
ncbi:Dynactin subunit 3 [Portunus trituberculatus]|uniref:Dynactin subunit 3 n=1 Tax=Portunus trituberculatus TaxID=210409 RepID=A0A5B7GTE8_PORTR|nr:Dynactin subunit 3 [Portunus trituberculatus]